MLCNSESSVGGQIIHQDSWGTGMGKKQYYRNGPRVALKWQNLILGLLGLGVVAAIVYSVLN